MSRFGALGVRIYGAAALTAVIALLLGTLVLQSGARSQALFNWVRHTQDVIISIDTLEGRLGRAESSLRGYLLTRDDSYLDGFDPDLAESKALAIKLNELVADNPVQAARAVRLARLTNEKANVMSLAVVRIHSLPAGSLLDPRARARGRNLMTAISHEAGAMRDDERRLLAVRGKMAEQKVAEAKALLIYGCPILVLLICGIAWLIRVSISRPLANLLDVVTRFGGGDRQARAITTGHSVEFRRLAFAYNEMAEHLVLAMDHQQDRQGSVQLMSEMAHRFQAIRNEGELLEVLDCFMPQVMPDLAGVLYLHNHSRNMLLRVSTWGNPQASPEMFPPADCWGLRRGQPHSVDKPGVDMICTHAAGNTFVERRCEPLLAGGEVLGLLYVEGHITDENRFRLDMLMENVALALINENLRSRLHEQSIRDPLTKLFNRRYMEEALTLETVRAGRSGGPLSIVMCDIDHFKRFNDDHGHEAGDILLSAVAALIQTHFRGGDIVCRYGGEEFTVIAPGAASDLMHRRLEALRLAIHDLTIDYHGRRLGPVTMSFGVDYWSGGDVADLGEMMGNADRALFRAKRLGRNRIEFAAAAQFPKAVA